MIATCVCGSPRSTYKWTNRAGERIYYCRDCGRKKDASQLGPMTVPEDKKVGEFSWREWGKHITARQRLVDKASWAQKSGVVAIEGDFDVAVIKGLADAHFGSLGVDYESVADFTDNVVGIPYLFTALFGDDTDNFAQFKNVMPVLNQGMTPAQQDTFLESWLADVAHKVLFSVWGNHAEFEEKSTGRNSVKRILSKKTVHFDGIGVAHIKFGNQQYKIAVTHKTRNHSSLNLTHGLKWLARRDIPDADAYIAGDKHDPAYEISNMHGQEKIFMLLGTLKKRDSFGERYFSYFAAQNDGALTINRKTHDMRAHRSLAHALEYARLVNGA